MVQEFAAVSASCAEGKCCGEHNRHRESCSPGQRNEWRGERGDNYERWQCAARGSEHSSNSPSDASSDWTSCVAGSRIPGGAGGVGGKGRDAGGRSNENACGKSGGGEIGKESWKSADQRGIRAGAGCAGGFCFQSTNRGSEIAEGGAADLSARRDAELHHRRCADRSGSGQARADRRDEDFAGAEAVPASGDGRAAAV